MRSRRNSEPGGAGGRVPGDMAVTSLSRPVAVGDRLQPTFTAFYRASYPDVVRALAVTLGDRDLGKEAADEAMVRCYQRWKTVSAYDNPAGWVYRVGLNWATSVRRRLVRRRAMLQKLDAPVAVETTVTDPVIAQALDGLDIEMRAVVVCRLMLDWSVERTASTLGIAEGTVKSRLNRALEKLERSLHHLKGDA